MNYMKRACLYLLLGMLSFAACDDDDSDTGMFTPGDACFTDTLLTELETAGVVRVGIALSAPAPADYEIEVAASLEQDMVEGVDYILADSKVLVPQGATEVAVELELIDNRDVDPGRYVELRIMDAGGGEVVEPSHCRVEVVDDESECAVVFPSKELSCYEGGGQFVIPVCLQGVPSGRTVRFAVQQVGGTAVEGEDFTLLSPLEFDLTSVNDTAKIVIEPVNDMVNNPNRTLIYEITEVQGAKSVTSSNNCLVNILEDDVAVSFGNTSMTVLETGAMLLVPIRLTQAVETDMTVTVALGEGTTAVEGEDYVMERTVDVPAGQDSVLLELRVIDKKGVNPDRLLALEIESCSNGAIAIGDQRTCEIAIWDCDALLHFEYSSALCVSTESVLTLPVSLSAPLDHDVTFSLESGNTAVFSPSSDSYTIPAGSTSVSVDLNVAVPLLETRDDIDISFGEVLGATADGSTSAALLFRLNKANWSIAYCTSEEASGEGEGNGLASCLIDDDDLNTWWHNQWSHGGSIVLPCDIVVNLGGVKRLTELHLTRRYLSTQIQCDTKEAEVYLTTSTDWETAQWELVATLEWSATDANDNTRILTWEEGSYPSATFVKITVTRGRDNNAASLSDLTLWGWQE